MKTSIDGIFAAGDVTNHRLKQVVVASGQGAIAAKSAYEFLKKQ
jgi:thioredoxin reductase